MNILIYGGKGWIGSQFVDILKILNIDFKVSSIKVDLNLKTEILNEIENYKPTNVISFIGRTHGKIGDKYYSTIDYLEQDEKLVENMRDNLVGPQLLAGICEDLCIHFTYMGTGCIFTYKDFDLSYKFLEEDDANFFGFFSFIVSYLS